MPRARAATRALATAKLTGYVERITASGVVGWAAETDNPEPLTVELLIDGLETGRVVANMERGDLIEAGVGSGRHGFVLPIPRQLMDNHAHAVAVRIVGATSLLTSALAEQIFHEPPPLPPLAADLPAPKLHRSIAVSVIMPTFNRGEVMEMTAGRFLRLVDRLDAELVIIDDGSWDDTHERLNRLAIGASNLVTDQVPNGGPARARNLAASMSRGEILVFVGDDTAPVDDDFLLYHNAAHQRMSKIGQAVLGKISWPDADQLRVNYVMSHIQGVGEQQFGYNFMKGYQWYDWRLFYSSNVSVKKRLVHDWSKDGFDSSFPLAALEDQEFSLRTTLRLQERGEEFGVFYVPAAQLVHYHPYSVASFLARQNSAGMMAQRFLELHPSRAADLGLTDLLRNLATPPDSTTFPIEHYYSVFEGLKSWALVIENHYGLGQQNWHDDLLRVVFQLAFFEGFLRAQNGPDVNLAAGCRHILEMVRTRMHRAIAVEGTRGNTWLWIGLGMFSVLIPSFNHREYLTGCVVSAVRSLLVSEVLLVDDGSTDRSVELFDILQRISPKVRILPSPPGENLGAHARLNQLVKAAANDWVAPLNSDDQFVPGRFEAVRQIAVRSEADLIFGDLVLTDGQDNRIGLRKALRHNEVPWPPIWNLPAMLHERHWLPLLLLQNIAATTTNLVFTKKLHAELGGFRPLRYCHDWDFMLRAALRTRIEYAPAMLSYYRLHKGNTIKEGSDLVNREVRRMLASLFIDYPALMDDDDLVRTLHANHHVSPPEPLPLAIVIKDPLTRELLQSKVSAVHLPVLLSDSVEDVPAEIHYIYQPAPVGAAALSVNDIRQLLLALAVRGYDALLILRHPGDAAAETELADALVLRRGAIGRWRAGSVRHLRAYPLSCPMPEGERIAVPDIPSRAPPVRVPIVAPLIDRDRRPVVFVLPAFLAVGGVERVVLETMRQLRDRWRFVVVTTEALRPEQGSEHAEAMQLAAVYDLAELTRPEDRLRAFQVLRDWHAPSLIWIVNGAPWQVEHAADIRTLIP